MGDEIQFLRFLAKLESRAATVLYEGDPRLIPVLTRSFPNIEYHPIRNGDLLPNAVSNAVFDCHAPLGVPTGLLLPKAADWRWQCPTEAGAGRIYASHRLFRQDVQGDWAEPVAGLETAMDELFQRA